jgi:hypothetical protein
MAIVSESKNVDGARKVLSYIESDAGIAVFKKYGFLIQ